MKKLLIIVGLVLVFFFGEIALTHSEKGNSFLIEDQEVAFSLNLENRYSDFNTTRVIDQEVQSFLKKWNIKGASVAITKDEELVYAKGFGYADEAKKELVKPGHLFRVASVSKLLSAIAIMKLHEDGVLDLDDRVFGPQGILDTSMFSDYADHRYEEISIVHLLNHTAGWSRRASDPMFNSLHIARQMDVEPPVDIDHIIEYTLSRRLYYDPGQRYSYSNVGYGILGKIIEVKSGMPYEDYVMLNILKPAGIHDMHIGKSFKHEKYPNEVTYYAEGRKFQSYSIDGSNKLVPMFYGGNDIELLGPAGGWVASAPELAKLLTVLDGFNKQKDIISQETIDKMTESNLAGLGPLGWRGVDRHGTWWRTGYLNGSTALVVRQRDGVNWVILLNTSTYKQSRIQRYVSAMMFEAINSVELWPYLNLFLVDQSIPSSIADIPESNPLL